MIIDIYNFLSKIIINNIYLFILIIYNNIYLLSLIRQKLDISMLGNDIIEIKILNLFLSNAMYPFIMFLFL